MAKNKVKIDVSVDDKGSTKKVGVGARKAADGLDKAGTSAHSTDRRLKGASQQSSNTTKNFSKMAQGISGGLVPAYATLASTLFAVSAAFNFLKQAGQLATLQAGQVAYASATGTGLRTLANEIGKATDSMITFKDASEAAAIGTAAGLSPEQLVRLGKAAKDTSIILGRDVTDSFNRLVRGVTKAEPELLDELGIILRLDNASQKYAQAMGIVGRELTTFEKSQAVANDVLTQSEEKYGRILEILEVQPNVYAQLGKAFDDITNKIKMFADKALAPLARILTDTPELAIAAFGLFGASIVKNIIPGLSTLGATSKIAMQESMDSTRAATASLIAYNNALKAGRGDKKAGAALQQTSGAGIQKTLQAAGQKFKGSYKQAMADPSKLSKRQIQVMIKDYEKGTGQMMMLSKKQRTALIRDLKDLELANKVVQDKIVVDTQVAHNKLRIIANTTKNAFVVAFNGMKVAAAGLGRAMGFLMGAFGWVSLLLTAGMMIKDYIDSNKELTETEKKAIEEEKKRAQGIKDLTEKFKSLNEEMSKMPEVIAELTKGGGGSAVNIANIIAGALNNVAPVELEQGLDALIRVNAATEARENKITELQTAIDQRAAVLKAVKTDSGKLLPEAMQPQNIKQQFPAGTFSDKQLGYDTVAGISPLNAGVLGSEIREYQDAIEQMNTEIVAGQKSDTGKLAAQTQAFLDQRVESFSASENKIVQGSEALGNFQKALLGGFTKENKAVIMAADADLRNFVNNTVKPFIKLQADNATATEKFMQSLVPPGKFDAHLKSLGAELEKHRDLKEDMAELDKNNEEENSLLRRIALFQELASIERDRAQQRLALTVATQNLALKATPLQAQEVAREIQLLKATQAMHHAERERNSIMQGIQNKKDAVLVTENECVPIALELTEAEKHRLSMAQLTLEAEQGKVEAAQLQLDKQHQLNQAFKAGFEGATTKGINDLLTGEESSFKDVALGSVMGGLEGMAGQLSQQMSKGVSDTLFGAVGMEREKSADEVLQTVYDSATGALKVTMAEMTGAEGPITSGTGDSVGGTDPEGGLVNQIKEGSKSFAADFKGIWTDGNNSFKDKISKTFDLGGNTFKNIFDGFSDGFKDIMSGIGEGLKGFFGSFGGGARYGGIMKGYSEGGIARGKQAGYPAILHGTEAVVPLPSGEKIPVEMKGGAGGGIVNNISVTVNNEGKATTDMSSTMGDMGDQQAKQLGSLISASVQEEIIKQQRPGGLLSPIGVGA